MKKKFLSVIAICAILSSVAAPYCSASDPSSIIADTVANNDMSDKAISEFPLVQGSDSLPSFSESSSSSSSIEPGSSTIRELAELSRSVPHTISSASSSSSRVVDTSIASGESNQTTFTDNPVTLRSIIDRLKKQLKLSADTRNQFSIDNKILRKQNTNLQSENQQLEAQINQLEAQTNQLEAQINQLKKKNRFWRIVTIAGVGYVVYDVCNKNYIADNFDFVKTFASKSANQLKNNIACEDAANKRLCVAKQKAASLAGYVKGLSSAELCVLTNGSLCPQAVKDSAKAYLIENPRNELTFIK